MPVYAAGRPGHVPAAPTPAPPVGAREAPGTGTAHRERPHASAARAAAGRHPVRVVQRSSVKTQIRCPRRGNGGGVQTVPPAPRPPGPAAASRAGRTWRTCRRSPRSGRLASRRAPAHAQCLQLAEKDKTGEQDKEQKKNADSRNAERKGFFGLRQQITKPRSHRNRPTGRHLLGLRQITEKRGAGRRPSSLMWGGSRTRRPAGLSCSWVCTKPQATTTSLGCRVTHYLRTQTAFYLYFLNEKKMHRKEIIKNGSSYFKAVGA